MFPHCKIRSLVHTPVAKSLFLHPQREDLRCLAQMFCRCRQWSNCSLFPAPELYSKPQNLPERIPETIAWTSSTKSSASKSCIPVKLHSLSLEGLLTLPLVRFFNQLATTPSTPAVLPRSLLVDFCFRLRNQIATPVEPLQLQAFFCYR